MRVQNTLFKPSHMNIFNQRMQFLMLVILLISFGCKHQETVVTDTAKAEVSDNTKLNLNDAQLANAEIKSTVIQKQKILNYVTLQGAIDILPQDKLWVTTLIPGQIKSIFVKPGDQVKKGQALATLEDLAFINLQQDYLSSVSALHYAQIEYDRQKSLNDNQATSQKALLQTEEKYRQYQIEVASLEEKLKMISINPKTLTASSIKPTISITSPTQGQILSIPTHLGAYIEAGTTFAEILSYQSKRAVLKVFEKELPFIKIGQDVLLKTNTSDVEFKGKVVSIIREINTDGYAQVICAVQSWPEEILPGTYISAKIEKTTDNVIAVPVDAVVDYEGKSYIFVQNDDHNFEIVEIVIGAKDGNFIQIAQPTTLVGLNVVSHGAYTLLMALKNIEE